MAIAPPSDLMLDVARAADPAQVREATARLQRLAADPAAANEGFGKALVAAQAASKAAGAASQGADVTPKDAMPKAPAMASAMASLRGSVQPKTDAYQKFEAVLLQSFVESMLPKDDESFGDATTSGIYRSMMAEQLATQISKAGGIGIAKAIEKAHPADHSAKAVPTSVPASAIAVPQNIVATQSPSGS